VEFSQKNYDELEKKFKEKQQEIEEFEQKFGVVLP